MCGIFGGVTESLDAAEGLLKRSLCLAHRGPDSEGRFIIHSGTQIAFGQHFRLAIQDLSEAADQPMESASGRHSIIFNGEIYNTDHLRQMLPASVQLSLKSTSDTEVLLELWEVLGPQALDHLEGMFALAVFDWDQRVLHLARDMFGVKPLFFASTASSFSFSSEIEPLVEGSKHQLNARELAEFLVLDRYDRRAETVFRGIFQVPPGGSISIPFDSRRPNNGSWKSQGMPELRALDWRESLTLVREEFFRSVELHMISDAPLAFALSGGLDSSAIVCAARILFPHVPIHTFSYISEDPNQTEEHWIDLVNERVGAIVHKVRLSDYQSGVEPFEFARKQGAPFNNVHFFAQYLVFRAARDAGFKVILEGQGGDEILGGYNGYLSSRLSKLWSEGQLTAGIVMLKGLDRSRSEKINILLSSLLRVVRHSLLRATAVGIRSIRKMRTLGEGRAKPKKLGLRMLGQSQIFHLKDGIRGELWRSATWDLLPRILRHGDRNAMAHGVENRVPFLGQRFARTMLSLPDEHLVGSDGRTKLIFREAMRGVVPDEIIDREDKKGFEAENQPILSRFGYRGNLSATGFGTRLALLRIWLLATGR